jgi:8-oxo-dGTP diphosphatase
MKADDQGTGEAGRRRYQAIPRTLIFLTNMNPQTGVRDVLLLKGAPDKRLWANKYNGLGGHVEAGEDVYSAALREVAEETGIIPAQLTLRGVVNIDTGSDANGPRPGVLMFVFHGQVKERNVQTSTEGAAEWLPVDNLQQYPLVDDLYALIPRVLAGDAMFYGHYAPQPDGALIYHFR